MTNDISALLLDSAILLVVGMSVVFVFLTILIFAIHAIEWFANKLPSEESVTNKSVTPSFQSAPTAAPAGSNVDPKVVAAITAAVHQHRSNS